MYITIVKLFNLILSLKSELNRLCTLMNVGFGGEFKNLSEINYINYIQYMHFIQ